MSNSVVYLNEMGRNEDPKYKVEKEEELSLETTNDMKKDQKQVDLMMYILHINIYSNIS